MPKIIVFPDVDVPGWGGEEDSDAEWWQVWDLEEALQYDFQTDAHFAPYHIEGEDHCPRINSKAFPLANPVYDIVVWDVDFKDQAGELDLNAAWTDAFGGYHTQNGVRLYIQAPKMSWQLYESWWRGGAKWLKSHGVVVDPRASDKTRIYRLPRVVRDGVVLNPKRGWRQGYSGGDFPFGPVEKEDIAGSEPQEPLSVADRIDESGRNDALFRIGCHLKEKGFPAGTILVALQDLNGRVCKPPLAEDEVSLIASSVDRYQVGQLSLLAIARPGENAVMRSGSQAEMADIVLRGLDSSHEVVSVDGQLWAWSGAEWTLCDDVFRREVLALDGAQVGKKRLQVSAMSLRGAYDIALVARRRENFFKDGVVIDGQVNGRAVHASDRLRWNVAGPVGGSTEALERVLGDQFTSLRDGRARLLQEFCGACLLGEARRYERALVLLGEGANGKSVFLNALESLFPVGSVVSVGPHLWSGYSLATLDGARLNVCTELPEKRFAETATFKSIISGDPVEARRIYGHPFTLRSKAGHIFATNVLPPAEDLPPAFWRRWYVIDWPNVIPEAARDLDLAAKLREERGGMLAWMLEGAERLRSRGRFDVPDSSSAAIEAWKRESDPLVAWLEEEKLRKGWHPTGKIYNSYRAWCSLAGVKNISSQMVFSRKLRKHLKKVRKNNIQGFEVVL